MNFDEWFDKHTEFHVEFGTYIKLPNDKWVLKEIQNMSIAQWDKKKFKHNFHSRLMAMYLNDILSNHT